MTRSKFIDGLEQAIYDHQKFDSYDMEEVMKYIEKHMKPFEDIEYRPLPSKVAYTTRYGWDQEDG